MPRRRIDEIIRGRDERFTTMLNLERNEIIYTIQSIFPKFREMNSHQFNDVKILFPVIIRNVIQYNREYVGELINRIQEFFESIDYTLSRANEQQFRIFFRIIQDSIIKLYDYNPEEAKNAMRQLLEIFGMIELSLDTTKWSNEISQEDYNNNPQCIICQEDFTPLDILEENVVKHVVSCGNIMHKSCLLKWFQRSHNRTCPLCRNKFGKVKKSIKSRKYSKRKVKNVKRL